MLRPRRNWPIKRDPAPRNQRGRRFLEFPYIPSVSEVADDYKPVTIGSQNVVSFTCSDEALPKLLDLLQCVRDFGDQGSSRSVVLDFDGDGQDKVGHISANGLTLDEWKAEHERLEKLRNESETNQID